MTDTDEEYEENIEENIISIYDKPFSIDDEFVIYFQKQGEVFAKIKSIEIDESKILLSIDNDDYILEMNEEEQILLNTSDYEIIDIVRVIEFDIKELDDITNDLITKDTFPEIQTVEAVKKIYSDVDKKEDLISSLIVSMDVQNSKYMINLISDISQEFMTMIKNTKEKSLQHFPDVIDFLNKEKIPDWLIPLSKDYKRLYFEKIEGPIIEDDYKKVNFANELEKIYDLTHEKGIRYQSLMNIYYSSEYRALQNTSIDIPIENGYTINKYNNDYFRDCITSNTCSSVDMDVKKGNIIENITNYKIDERRNHKGLLIPNTIDSETVLEILQRPPSVIISSLLYFPDNHTLNLPISYDSNTISLAEKCMLIRHNYTIKSKKTRINEILKDNFEMIDCKLEEEYLSKYDSSKNYESDKTYQFNIKETIDKDLFHKLLLNYIPDQKTIIDNFIYKEYYNYIFNYEDFEKLFFRYNLNISDIEPDIKLELNNIIDKNIEKYKKAYRKSNEKAIYKKTKYKTKTLSQEEKIESILEFINKQLNEKYKNYYLRKFIDQFTRKKEHVHEDDKWLYNKFNNQKILCTHCLYSSKIDEDPNMYDEMMTKYGLPAVDGSIYCKVCGQFLDSEEFNTFEGFTSEGKAITKEAIIEDKKSLELTEDQQSIFDIVQILSSNIGIKLIESDVLHIVELYDTIDNKNFSDNRYETLDIFKNHLKVKSAENKNRKKAYQNIYAFISQTNKLLFSFISILIYIQTSISGNYKISNIKLIDLSDTEYLTDPKINYKVLHEIRGRIKNISENYKEDIFWKYSSNFLDEQGEPSITNPTNQLSNIVKYLLKCPQILDRIQYYQEYIGISKNEYLNKYWTVYRPLPTNKTIENINKVINESVEENKQYLINNNITKYSLENITLLQSIDESFYTTKYKSVNIKNIELLNNKSFLRFYDFILSLYGYQEIEIEGTKNFYMQLLINRLLDTSEDKSYLESIFRKYDWKQRNRISFPELRKIIYDINKYCKNKGECVKTLNIFNHISFRNTSLQLLNTYPKRNYTYNPNNVIPNVSFDKLEDNSTIRNIFNIYCYDDVTKAIVKRPKGILNPISVHILIDRIYDPCEKENISPSNENFEMIFKNLYKQNSFKEIFFIENHKYDEFTNLDIEEMKRQNIILIESRLSKILNSDIYKQIPLLKEIFDKTETYIQNTGVNIRVYEELVKTFDEYFTKVIVCTETMLRSVIEYIRTTDKIKEAQKRLLKIDKLYDIFMNIIDRDDLDINIIYNFIHNIIFMISRIKNQTNKSTHGCTFHNNIPKDWKLSDYNKDMMSDFISENEYLLHNSIFMKRKNKSDNGFMKYMLDPKVAPYFQELYNYIKPYIENIDLIVGKQDNLFTKDYASYLIKYIFVLILRKIVEFINIENEDNEDSECKGGNEIFQSLEEITITESSDKNKKISSFLMDIIINIIQEYNDPFWIININNTSGELKKRIAQQKEREKQVLLGQFDSMDNEQKIVYKTKQTIGAVNWFQDLAKKNQEFLNSKDYQDLTDAERKEKFKEILEESEELDTDINISTEGKEEEEGYDYNDEVDPEDVDGDDEEDDSNFEE